MMIKKAMAFQGKLNKRKYFEGWYYKLVSKDLNHSLSVISGISLNDTNPHSFLQIAYSKRTSEKEELLTKYLSFDKKDFNYDYSESKVTVGKNSFDLEKIELDYSSEVFSIKADVGIKNLIPIKTNLISPSIMGYFAYMPFMECIHAIVSMDHDLTGKVILNGQEIDFSGGKGYIEKDLGKSFPTSYIWMQTNNFKKDKTSFMLSYATIPFLFFRFKGLISNLVISGQEYRFATYNFSRIRIKEIDDKNIILSVKKGKYRLEVEAFSKNHHVLPSPKDGEMNQTINESLLGEIKVRLFNKKMLIFEDTGYNSGIEMMMK